jgi:hypothetical protein
VPAQRQMVSCVSGILRPNNLCIFMDRLWVLLAFGQNLVGLVRLSF